MVGTAISWSTLGIAWFGYPVAAWMWPDGDPGDERMTTAGSAFLIALVALVVVASRCGSADAAYRTNACRHLIGCTIILVCIMCQVGYALTFITD
jgi:hypothetical protein